MEQRILECLPAVLKHARTHASDYDEAEELVVRTLAWAIGHAHQFDPRFGLENWLIFIADMLSSEPPARARL